MVWIKHRLVPYTPIDFQAIMAASHDMKEIESIEDIFEKHLPSEELSEVKRILYGKELPCLNLGQEAKELAEDGEFQLSGFSFNAAKESTRPPKIVRVGLIQNKITGQVTGYYTFILHIFINFKSIWAPVP